MANISGFRTPNAIKCCRHCVAPKRHPGCHGNCPEDLKEKAVYDILKEAERKKKAISHGITAQRTASVTKALRERRNKYG